MQILFFIIIIFIIPLNINGQQIVLNEIVSSNSLIYDEDQESPDWIELYNGSPSSILLSNYYLSDKRDSLLQWNLPAVNLQPDGYIAIFASGKNRRTAIFWETVIDQGAVWQYVTTPVSNSWLNPEFDDSSWFSGPSGIGYGDEDDATLVANTVITAYLRHAFELSDTSSISHVMLHMDYDDAYVAYLNGVEISRSNIGVAGIPPDYNESAITFREATIYQGLAPEGVDISDHSALLIQGTNLLAVEVHNYGFNSSDLSIIPFLTLGYDQEPQNGNGSNPILGLSGTEFHANFKLKASGEDIFLSNVNQLVIDSIPAISLAPDHSYGRKPDGTDNWYFFEEPTFGSSNTAVGYVSFSDSVIASHVGGFYTAPLTISLSTVNNSNFIYYSLDGSVPDENAQIYSTPISLSNTTVLRARSLEPLKIPGLELSETYLINEQTTLPVVSIVTDPANLWADSIGMYANGPNWTSDFPHFGANFWEDWERPAHISFFDENGLNGFKSNCGIKINGGWSRGFPQKSLAVFFRGKYGNKQLDYQLFPNSPVDKFQSFVLRNSGNDWNATMLRDGFMQSLVSGIDIDIQGYRPAIVFLNGEYWGIHNMREKVNEHYVSTHYDIDPLNIDLLENNSYAVHGSSDHYEEIIYYIQNNNMQIQSSYDFIDERMDLNEYLNYMCTQIYLDNTDWPGNNIKYWRNNAMDGKWRWILYDTDFGFSLFNSQAYNNNTLAFALENNPNIGWPNPPWSTLLFRKLIENEQFKQQFINRFADLLNSVFNPLRVTTVLDSIENILADDIIRHLNLWNHSIQNRNNHLQQMRVFANSRETNIRSFIINQFSLSGAALVSLNASEGGSVIINSLQINTFPWQGYYFNNNLITVTAIASPGYTFVGWSGDISSFEPTVAINPNSLLDLTADFELSDELTGDIVINEINYNSAASHNSGDWIELYNNGIQDLNLDGWILTDGDSLNQYIFPDISLNRESYLVVIRSDSLFSEFFPTVSNYIGETNFGLSGAGETIYLYNNSSIVVDSVNYSDSDPWPVAADGTGSTLELINPALDNNVPQNWQAAMGFGTPGNENSVFISEILQQDNKLIPGSFFLFQNFPNPFNPSTRIKYSLAKSSRVELKIYDIKGRQIQSLINKYQTAAEYEFVFDAGGLASGIYFYSIFIDNRRLATRKMIKIQ